MSNRKKPSNIKDRLAAAKLAERSVEVCLRGDLVAENESLERELKRLRSGMARSMGDQAEEAAIAARIQANEAEMVDALLELTIRALPKSDRTQPDGTVKVGWRSLVEKHPPREGNQGDAILGANFQALMEEASPLCVVHPELDEDDWERMNDVLSSRDFDRIFTAVWEVNREGGDVPKSLLASRVMTEQGAEQK